MSHHIYTWRPYWSCGCAHLYKLPLLCPRDASHEIWNYLSKFIQKRRSLKMDDIRRQTMEARAWVFNKHAF